MGSECVYIRGSEFGAVWRNLTIWLSLHFPNNIHSKLQLLKHLFVYESSHILPSSSLGCASYSYTRRGRETIVLSSLSPRTVLTYTILTHSIVDIACSSIVVAGGWLCPSMLAIGMVACLSVL